MPGEHVQPDADEQQAAAEQKQRYQSGPNKVTPTQALAEAPKEIKNPAPADGTAAKHDASKGPKAPIWPPVWYLVVELCIAVAIAYFAWGQVDMGRRQWDATEKQWDAMLEANKVSKQAADAATESNKIASDTAEKQLRAYVHIGGAKLITEPTRKDVFTLTLQTKNYGQTPAYGVKVYVDFKFIDPRDRGDDPINTPDVMEEHEEMLLGSGAEFPVSKMMTIEKSHLDKIGSGRQQLLIYGRIDYLDIYHRIWTGPFKLIWRGALNNGRVSFDTHGNFEEQLVPPDPKDVIDILPESSAAEKTDEDHSQNAKPKPPTAGAP